MTPGRALTLAVGWVAGTSGCSHAAAQPTSQPVEVRTSNESTCRIATEGAAVRASCRNDALGFSGEPEPCVQVATADVAPAAGAEGIWVCTVSEIADMIATTSASGVVTWAGQVGDTIGGEATVRVVDVVPDPAAELLVRVSGRDGGECDSEHGGGDSLQAVVVILKWRGRGLEAVFVHEEGDCPGDVTPRCEADVSLGPWPAGSPGSALPLVVTPREARRCGRATTYVWDPSAFRYRPRSARARR